MRNFAKKVRYQCIIRGNELSMHFQKNKRDFEIQRINTESPSCKELVTL